MTDWRVAKSLLVLRNEVNRAAPNRNKTHDGTIGDAAHSSRRSDHNPDPHGVVRAMDITDDPTGGHDADEFTEWLRRTRDPRVKYVIDQYRMFSSYATSQYPAWTWRPYSGPNAHTKHSHISVTADARADDTRPWGWLPPPPEEDEMPSIDEIRAVIREEVNSALDSNVGDRGPLRELLRRIDIHTHQTRDAVNALRGRLDAFVRQHES